MVAGDESQVHSCIEAMEDQVGLIWGRTGSDVHVVWFHTKVPDTSGSVTVYLSYRQAIDPQRR